jgi:hypothetical protein
MQVTITWHNAGPHTIWGKLAAKLDRDPTHAEVLADMRRITDESLIERAAAGKLPHQRGRT